MPYDPNKHHRRSIRLKGYDYSQSGYYYLTLSVKNMDYLFGEIVDHQMLLNDAGKMVEKWFHELDHKYPDIECGEFVVMPNHFHCIIENNGQGNPNMKDKTGTTWKPGELHDRAWDEQHWGEHNWGEHNWGEHIGSPVRNVVQWFKTMSTNEYIRGVKTMGWKRFDGKLWHINYWEHIIRDQNSFDYISSYILENPKNWHTDKLR
jgi:REP element-mobilizing transposase RayT